MRNQRVDHDDSTWPLPRCSPLRDRPALDASDPGVFRARDTTTVRPCLPPAVTSAAKIARFLQMHGFNPKVVGRFRVNPHGQQPIRWRRFCYASRTCADLYQWCARHEAISYPVGVHGTVHSIAQDTPDLL
ncbi:hypothetical protein [Streptomyces sp. NPDC006668]|uniref:hypothetical protein n=1 Tax=Streptomyces sp. NPDC006668 TaxID=3156903 RepID=UPI00340CFC1F